LPYTNPSLTKNILLIDLEIVFVADNGSANTTSQWMMLAAASTIAGNLTILAAAIT
jgi:hypothetical protein